MKIIMRYILFISLFVCLMSAGEKKQTVYSPPGDIPAVIADSAARLGWLAEHYWGNFNFGDTALVHNPDYTEQAFVEFLGFLGYVPQDAARQAMKTLMTSASVNRTMFDYLSKTTEHYLYDPQSPYNNEELYIPVLESIISSSLLPDIEKTRPRHQLVMAQKNRIGMQATDFTFTMADGKHYHMYDLKAKYTLLFFNNPDCAGCRDAKAMMSDDAFLSKISGKLAILALYPNDDGNLDLWRKTAYPPFLINGYDENAVIINSELYDLRASPTIYLLDVDKRVILKTYGMDAVLKYFENDTEQK